MVTHQGLTNFLSTMADVPGLSLQDTLLAVTTNSFDIHGLELYLPLIRGAACHICSSEKVRDAQLLRMEIQRVKPTIMQATPATWKMLFAAGWKNEEKVKILCGGEPLMEPLKTQFMSANSEVWNMFGPTETTIWSTVKRITNEGPITIGKPIANTQIFILDNYLRPTPAGVAGELCIAGDGLARGYINLPELTAEKFIDNPFAAGKKLYKTGDLARWRPDGELEFLERIDSQVKIRGFRIELGEIEAQLCTHPEIQDCALIAREHDGEKQLVCYFVTGIPNGSSPDSRQLREYLRTSLPEYMMPAFFVQLEQLPLTPNGKIDRKDLANRKLILKKAVKADAPRTKIEANLLEIWKDVLNLDELGTEEGFFEAGGNSILAVTLVQRIQKTLGYEITVTSLFKYSNIKELCGYLSVLQPVAPAPQSSYSEDQGAAMATEESHADASDPGSLPDYYRESLAIIGISCCFPGAGNAAEFWSNLREGKESITFFTKKELEQQGVPKSLAEDPAYVAARSAMEGKERFDPGFFNISLKDAELMDPQLRQLLLHSWKAVEDAGYVASQIPETGVFMSASNSFYQELLRNAAAQDESALTASTQYVTWLLAQGGTIPTMVSYKLGLQGPSYFIQSNCSSSLAGLHAACNTLLSGDSRYALVGSATIFPSSSPGYLYQPGLNFSSDGHVKTFDASADGMVSGEGVAVILLKRALDAIEDGDHIYALIRGVCMNNDGADKAGFYAPSVKGQSRVILKTLDATKIDPETITYLEAHGTGTKLGDRKRSQGDGR